MMIDPFNLEPDYGIDDSPEDLTRVNQVILYFNDEDTKAFKKMGKELMKKYWPDTYQTEGNLSDLILKIFQYECSTTDTQKS